MNKKLSILITDDHRLFRQGLHMILNEFENFENVYEASNGEEALNITKANTIDIILMDIRMPIMNGIEATIKIKKEFPRIKVIALSMYDDQKTYYSMLNAGVSGFLLKDSSVNELKNAIKTVQSGASYFSQELLRRIILDIGEEVKNEKLKNKINNSISNREKEIIFYITKGNSSKEIAEILHISKRTVENHKSNIFKKTKCKNSTELIFYAIKNKLVDVS